jgi:hypothetical protein
MKINHLGNWDFEVEGYDYNFRVVNPRLELDEDSHSFPEWDEVLGLANDNSTFKLSEEVEDDIVDELREEVKELLYRH